MLREIKRQKMDEFVASLRKKANIKIYRENLDKVKLALSSPSDSDSAGGESQFTTDGTDETRKISADSADVSNSDNSDKADN